MKAKDIKINSWYATTINHREQIKDLVSLPIVDICESLYDLNVPICMHTGYDNKIFLVIDYDLLSKSNKQAMDDLLVEMPTNFSQGNFSPLGEHTEIKITFPVHEETEVSEMREFFWNVVELFEMQDVESFIDEERFIKNVYTIPDIFSRYICCEKDKLRCVTGSSFEESEDVEEFLKSLGYQKVKASEFRDGKTSYNGVCEYLWIDNDIDQTWLPDYRVYGVILKNKDALFGEVSISKENLNFDEILRVLNRSAKNYYDEQYIFNPEDERFYLNEELLNKHNNYLQYKQISEESVMNE